MEAFMNNLTITTAPAKYIEQRQETIATTATNYTGSETEEPSTLTLEYLCRIGTADNYSLNAYLAQDEKEDAVVVYKAQIS
ncbi:hypothetical protein FPQ18DRAFT_392701 [Pyronema domesticum]|nr:hypothetical protein FPQ18DRAFT_392701 [Pyronema domesticum]